MERFIIHYNAFNGAEVTLLNPPIDEADVVGLIKLLSEQSKDLIWIHLPIEHAAYIPSFTAQGFVFHLCDESQLTLIFRITANSYAPFAPTHTVGVGGLVQNSEGDVLLIRDRMMGGKGFKLPGGYVDLGEPVERASEREVLEETGIAAQFQSMVGLISKYPHQHGKANLYLVCRLSPTTTKIDIQDTDEIEMAVWMNPSAFIADSDSSRFHRHLVASLLSSRGLEKNDFVFDNRVEEKKEIFLKT